MDVIFNEFLGVSYDIVIDKKEYANWVIELENDNKLIVLDHFFNKYPKELEYLKLENIPNTINYEEKKNNQFIPEKDIPIIYGTNQLLINNEKLKTIKCGIDIFASCFFMLTRWEESVNKIRDNHNRFLGIESLAYRNNFLNRPIVNEYIEMLKNMLLYLGLKEKLKDRDYRFIFTCDVDEPFDCTIKNIPKLIKTCASDIIKRKSLALALKRVRRFLFNRFDNYIYDTNYTFDWYMDICEKIGINATFYFIPDSREKNNACYEIEDNNIQNLLKYINSRGHEIGVHGSYQTYQNKEKAKLQKNMLDDTLISLGINQKIVGNRQHYLRWDSALTPSVLEYAGFEYDSTGFYADRCGFRYGVCNEFSMFDFLNKKKLKIKQRPLIVMECTIIDESYMGYGFTPKAFDVIKELQKKCIKYNGDFILLWHNNYFFLKEHYEMFEKLMVEELK
ncbi:polysaccharide deacetylase family protein [Halarcobacter sp.]|uniref:polysaccharide deacetylase family protein n=1 Tax=Halarcobacter sp. TaxID=2321133 RepID=UPI003A8F4D2C